MTSKYYQKYKESTHKISKPFSRRKRKQVSVLWGT